MWRHQARQALLSSEVSHPLCSSYFGRGFAIFLDRGDEESEGFFDKILLLVLGGVKQVQIEVVGREEDGEVEAQGFGCAGARLGRQKELAPMRRMNGIVSIDAMGVYKQREEAFLKRARRAGRRRDKEGTRLEKVDAILVFVGS